MLDAQQVSAAWWHARSG